MKAKDLVRRLKKIVMAISYTKVDIPPMMSNSSIRQCRMRRCSSNKRRWLAAICLRHTIKMYLSGSRQRKHSWKQNRMQHLNLSTTNRQCGNSKKNKQNKNLQESKQNSNLTLNSAAKNQKNKHRSSVSANKNKNNRSNNYNKSAQKGGFILQ